MLSVYYGDMSESIYNPVRYFKIPKVSTNGVYPMLFCFLRNYNNVMVRIVVQSIGLFIFEMNIEDCIFVTDIYYKDTV